MKRTAIVLLFLRAAAGVGYAVVSDARDLEGV